MSLGLLQNRHRHLVKSVCEALPTTEELGGESSASGEEDCEEGCASEGPGGHASERVCSAEKMAEHDDGDDDQHMFITLMSSWQTSRSAHARQRPTRPVQRLEKRDRDFKEVSQREPKQRIRTP